MWRRNTEAQLLKDQLTRPRFWKDQQQSWPMSLCLGALNAWFLAISLPCPQKQRQLDSWHLQGSLRVGCHVWFFAAPWTIAHQAPLSLGFSRQEHWSGLPFPSPGHLPDPRIEPVSLASHALTGRFFITTPPERKPHLQGQWTKNWTFIVSLQQLWHCNL